MPSENLAIPHLEEEAGRPPLSAAVPRPVSSPLPDVGVTPPRELKYRALGDLAGQDFAWNVLTLKKNDIITVLSKNISDNYGNQTKGKHFLFSICTYIITNKRYRLVDLQKWLQNRLGAVFIS